MRHLTPLLWTALAALATLAPAWGDDPLPQDLIAKAGRGDARAGLALAYRYRDGAGVKRDYAEALRWAHPAADRGYADAQDFVGWMYFEGLGVQRSPEIAAGYFKAAAGQSTAAAWNLGQCYFAGLGVDQDVPKALAAWTRAAARGHGRSASTAAMVYLAGDGVPADAKEARRLAERAAELNDPSGHVVLGEIHFRAGETEQARKCWTRVARTKSVGPIGPPTQPSDQLAAQQGADLLKLTAYRDRKPEPGRFALVTVPHVHQGWNNCGATSCAMLARAQGKPVGGWDVKRLCPSPPGTGTDWGDLLKASEKLALRWKLVTFTPDADGFVKAAAFARGELDAGRPLVVDFKYTGAEYPGGEAGHTLALVGYVAGEDLYVLCNPALATPGLQLMSAKDLQRYWRSDHYGAVAKNVLARPAIVLGR
ncbi:C39 family peptidase [Limnoglobus roseus]|uniref:Sel1 repeat family protein n=1 Tax=Limnoglobus roseus TaxID=2598579 RepID=A0A5C1AU70_9BACT|nr:C39 family peptidase [Limnoglobus roseus]QEL20774.1 sel1 repeat family protein [Limnoglobus roseus]